MYARRVLAVSRQLLTRNVLLCNKNLGESVRECHAKCVPARNKISLGEKIAMGIILSLSMWAIPAWVMYHIPDYQKEQRNVYTGN